MILFVYHDITASTSIHFFESNVLLMYHAFQNLFTKKSEKRAPLANVRFLSKPRKKIIV